MTILHWKVGGQDRTPSSREGGHARQKEVDKAVAHQLFQEMAPVNAISDDNLNSTTA